MLVEKDGQLFSVPKTCRVCSDPVLRRIVWAIKLIIHGKHVRVLDAKHLIVSTMDGKVVLLDISRQLFLLELIVTAQATRPEG